MLHGRTWRGGIGRARRWPLALVLLFLVSFGSSSVQGQDATRRVLILYPDSNVNRSALVAGEAIRKRLQERSSTNVKTHGEFLDLSQFSDDGHRQRVARYLAEKYAHIPLDVVVALGPDSLGMIVNNRSLLIPKVPIVFCCASSATLTGVDLPRDATGIISEFDIAKTASLAERLQPNARRLIVIAGAAPFDRRWAQIARRQLAAHEKRLNTRYLVGLPHDELLTEVANLPRDTIVIVLSIFRDGAGRDFVPLDIAEEIAIAANAPVYGPYDTLLGRGVVGGYMISFESVGTETADLVLDVLNGKDPSALPPRRSAAHAHRVDARQLERWNLAEKNLPADTVVLFKQSPLWEQHRKLVLATIGAFGVIATIVGNLLLQMRRRKRAEASLKDSEERMMFTAASTNTGLWQYDVPSKHLWAMEQCRPLFGLVADSPLLMKTFLRRVHRDDRPIVAAAIRTATVRAEPAEKRTEFRVVHPDGQTRWILASSKTHFGEEGKPVRVSGVFRDVTSRKIAEHETEQLARRLSTIQDEERQQIAEELHDSTTQHLVAVGLNMVSLQDRVAADAETRKLFTDIESSLEEATKELRTFTYLLHPPQLEKDGLRSALRRYLEGFGRRTELDTKLKISAKAEELPFSVQRALLRVVQEALANVHRHAAASKVSVTVKCLGDRVHLVVADDGKGANGTDKREPCSSFRAGVGIPGMTARLRRAGGDLKIQSGPRGTRLHGVMLVDGNGAGGPGNGHACADARQAAPSPFDPARVS
jgi:PAS domain S-box-containing protein